MNKKIKIIDLIDRIYHKNNIPKKIQIGENIYFYDCDMGYYRKSDEEYNLRIYLTEDLGLDVYEDLVREIEILEDNTEEQESLGESWKEVGERVGEWAKEFQKGFTESFSDIILSDKKDNTEEIEELDLKVQEGCVETEIYLTKRKINELVKTINEIRKDLNKKLW